MFFVNFKLQEHYRKSLTKISKIIDTPGKRDELGAELGAKNPRYRAIKLISRSLVHKSADIQCSHAQIRICVLCAHLRNQWGYVESRSSPSKHSFGSVSGPEYKPIHQRASTTLAFLSHYNIFSPISRKSFFFASEDPSIPTPPPPHDPSSLMQNGHWFRSIGTSTMGEKCISCVTRLELGSWKSQFTLVQWGVQRSFFTNIVGILQKFWRLLFNLDSIPSCSSAAWRRGIKIKKFTLLILRTSQDSIDLLTGSIFLGTHWMNTACELRLEPDTFCEESKVVGGQVSLYMGEFAPCVIY